MRKLVCYIIACIYYVSGWFPVNVGLRQGCVIYIYMDGVVREVTAGVLGEGLKLLPANGGRFDLNQLLFADDTAIEAEQRRC